MSKERRANSSVLQSARGYSSVKSAQVGEYQTQGRYGWVNYRGGHAKYYPTRFHSIGDAAYLRDSYRETGLSHDALPRRPRAPVAVVWWVGDNGAWDEDWTWHNLLEEHWSFVRPFTPEETAFFQKLMWEKVSKWP